MTVISRKPTAPPEVVPVIPRIQSLPNKSVVVDTQYTPRSTVVAYVEGSVYTVDYYSQQLSSGMATYGLDVTKSAVFQQYKKIKRLEIRLTEPLSGEQDATDKTFTIKGAGHITSGVIPNEGDAFVADVGDGREGVFQVNSSTQRTIFADTVYFVEFQLMFFSDKSVDRREDLENKVIGVFHYIRDYARWGKNPIVADNRYKCMIDLKEVYGDMVSHYFEWFYSREKGTLILPGQTQTTYDPFVVSTLMKTLSVSEVPQLLKVREVSTEGDNLLSQPTLWTALLRRDVKLLAYVNAKMGVISTENFSLAPAMRGLRFSGLDQIVYPLAQNVSIDTDLNSLDRIATMGSLLEAPGLYGDVNAMSREMSYGDPLNVTPLYPVLKDDFYIFSEAFYTNKAPMSLIEKLTRDFLQGETIAPEQLHYLAVNYASWGGLERFYYIPILLVIMLDLMRELL